jgi:hypothetical protein
MIILILAGRRRLDMTNYMWAWNELKEWAEKREEELDRAAESASEQGRITKEMMYNHYYIEIGKVIQKMKELEGEEP